MRKTLISVVLVAGSLLSVHAFGDSNSAVKSIDHNSNLSKIAALICNDGGPIKVPTITSEH